MAQPQEILQTLGERLGGSAHVRSVFGEPVTAGDRTVIPVARVAFGMGGGGGQRGDSETGGGGGGGGAVAVPAGVVEVSAAGTRFIHFFEPRRLAAALALGLLGGFVFGRFGRRR